MCLLGSAYVIQWTPLASSTTSPTYTNDKDTTLRLLQTAKN